MVGQLKVVNSRNNYLNVGMMGKQLKVNTFSSIKQLKEKV